MEVMRFRTRHLALLFFVKMFLSFYTLAAQENEYFVEKPDKNVKRVLVYEVVAKQDTSYLNRIVEFNKNGKVIKDEQPDYHIHLNYKYDDKGRLIEKEALYGESFANGIATYSYPDGYEIEKNQAMGFYSETVKELDDKSDVVKISTFYIAGGMGESKIQTETFNFDKNKLLSQRNIEIKYFDLEEPGEASEMKSETLIEKLKGSKLIKKENFEEIYTYNSKGMISTKKLFPANSKKQILNHFFEYNDGGILVKEVKDCLEKNNEPQSIDCTEFTIEREYNKQNKLKSITTKKRDYLCIEIYENNRLVSSDIKYSEKYRSKYFYKYEYFD